MIFALLRKLFGMGGKADSTVAQGDMLSSAL